MDAVARALEELRRLSARGAPRLPSVGSPVDASLVQAVADLVAARVGLYEQQRGHDLIPVLDRTIRSLLPKIGGH